ncbi:DUF3500 domain-containing protein [Ruegeria sp. 2012CJ41-6]|uniref:DUF3500 domain-containing protein n=1 Tax=Ruegeria spongiae TaxID=2942209 RepID=A0ABT0Q8C5_9RHOB|nr:DUF3500 domain-containing protein [Ruegeria spongiae]MCL6285807.1 DUF3500 domain-containing protein [Ruegeria spongiae]
MTFDRRTFLATGAASAALPFTASAQLMPSGAEMRQRAQSLLAALEEPQRAAVLFGFDTPDRLAWNFMTGSRRAPGLALEQMTPAQKDLAMDLLATAASAPGLEKAMNIMLQQDILRDEWGKGSADRNRERFSVQIYGLPSETGAWAWRWEGHHLSLSFTLLDDRVISTTPSAYSSEPNTVPSGPYRGLVVLKDEEALARALYSGLSDTARQRALVWPRSPGNILSNGGTEQALLAELAGVALGDLPQGQADMAARLVEVYTTEVLPAPMAAAQTDLNAQQDMAALRFAWGGADLDGSIYYRLTGQDILIEFASLRNQPLHLHAVFHDPARNFGRHMI